MNRSVRQHIPSFSLYGEGPARTRQTDPLHVESIQSRSSKYLWRIGNHRHVGLCQCVYVTAGPAAVDLEGFHAVLEGPTVIIIPSGTVHGFSFRADSQGYVLTLDLDRLLAMASTARQAPIAALFATPRTLDLASDRVLAARAAQLFEVLMQEFQQPDSFLAPVSAWLGCSVLWVLAGASLPAPPTGVVGRHDLERLRRFRQLLEANHLKHWPVQRYARELALSESSLNRLCMSLGLGTAFEAIQQRLALEAQRRLIFVAGPVAMIAAELGFKDPAYFCRFFRKHTGVSPTVFRHRQAEG